MRLKLLSIFLALQVFSFGLWSAFFAGGDKVVIADDSQQTLEEAPISLISASALEPEAYVNEAEKALDIPAIPTDSDANDLPSLPQLSEGVQPHFAARNMTDSDELLNPIHQNQVVQALEKLPEAHAESVDEIIFDYDPASHRGYGGGGTIILRGVNMELYEFVGVLVHETAHNVDSDFLVPQNTRQASSFTDGGLPLYETDPSLDFYRISWATDGKKNSGAVNTDFVSGYAMSDKHEDFAETYAYYVLHGKDFRVMTASSSALLEKYNFMKEVVFGGIEFQTGDAQVNVQNPPWDVTVLPFEVEYFLG